MLVHDRLAPALRVSLSMAFQAFHASTVAFLSTGNDRFVVLGFMGFHVDARFLHRASSHHAFGGGGGFLAGHGSFGFRMHVIAAHGVGIVKCSGAVGRVMVVGGRDRAFGAMAFALTFGARAAPLADRAFPVGTNSFAAPRPIHSLALVSIDVAGHAGHRIAGF